MTAPVNGVVAALTGARYDADRGGLADATGRSWHWVAAGAVPLGDREGRSLPARGWDDGWWLPAFAPKRFEEGAFALPTRMDDPAHVGLVAVAPGSRERALQALDTALRGLHEFANQRD